MKNCFSITLCILSFLTNDNYLFQIIQVGCCSLRVEHITLHKEKDGKEYVVEFDFLGKDSIRYHNEVPIEKQVLWRERIDLLRFCFLPHARE